jgi:hypothetical protein
LNAAPKSCSKDHVISRSKVTCWFLNSGKITADVPRRAFGFAILSREVEFVDLGTSFGVDIGADGRTELHLFEGEVLCSPSDADDNGTPIHVQANSAVEFAAGAGPNVIAIDMAPFSELMALRRHPGKSAGRVTGEQLALWLTADAAVATDDLGRVVSWQDIIYGDNVAAEDAVQADAVARPQLVENAIGGRRAIRFDGHSDWLLTTPLETTDDQTVLIVGQFTPNAFDEGRRWGGQILNYDGPPSRYLSNLLEPGVLQIGEPLLEEQFQPLGVDEDVRPQVDIPLLFGSFAPECIRSRELCDEFGDVLLPNAVDHYGIRLVVAIARAEAVRHRRLHGATDEAGNGLRREFLLQLRLWRRSGIPPEPVYDG